MNNKSLALLMAFSALILPAVSSAKLTNETIVHAGALSVFGANSIKLEQHAGRSIVLNKGSLEIKTTKVSMGFSLVDPQLILIQNGQKLFIDIDADNYSDEENFTMLGKNSGLNYDLYLRKTSSTQTVTEAAKTIICDYSEFAMNCGVDVSGNYNCVAGQVRKKGTQLARKTNLITKDNYKLTLGQNKIAKAEFTSTKERTEIKAIEELSRCQ